MNTQSNLNYSSLNSIAEMWNLLSDKFGSVTAVCDPHNKPTVSLNYSELTQNLKPKESNHEKESRNPANQR